jgi:hypothetical protein
LAKLKEEAMSDIEFSLKEVVKELRDTVKELEKSVNAMNKTLSDNYQKKSDCELCKTDLTGRINTANNWIIGVYGLILAAVGIFIALK